MRTCARIGMTLSGAALRRRLAWHTLPMCLSMGRRLHIAHDERRGRKIVGRWFPVYAATGRLRHFELEAINARR